MTPQNIGILVVMIIYMVGMVAIGAYYSKKNNDAGDFYLGGRKLGPFVTAMSAEASDMSGWLLMGLPGLAYLVGIAEAGWTAIGLAIGTYINWLIVAKRLRLYSAKANNAITIPDFFKNRYRDTSNALLVVSALFIVIFFVPYTASGFAACGKLFSTIFGVSYFPAMIVAAIIIIAYTTLGGFLAASTTDFIQSIVMTIALVIVLLFGVRVAGGFDAVMDNAHTLSGYFSLLEVHDPATNTKTAFSGLSIFSTLAWGLGYFGMPHILLRFMAIEDENKLKLSRRVASIWVVIAMFIAVAIGLIGRAMTKAGAVEMLTSSDSEKIIIKIASLMSQHGAIFVILAGIILSGILASTMSTADSQLLAASSSMSQNILKDAAKIKAAEKHSIAFARITVLIIAVIAVFLAKNPDSSVFRIVSFAWAGFGAAFGPVVLFALFWRRSNRWGALAGMIVGGVMVFVWKFLIRPLGGMWDIYELLPAFILSCIAIILVSLLTKAPSQEILDEFDSVKQG